MSISLVKSDSEVPKQDSLKEMTKFANYLKEREGVDLIETDQGFAIYNISRDECYIRDIYVFPEFRKQGVASSIADLVCVKARLAGCKILTGSVCPTTKGSTTSLDVLRGYGMKLHACSNNLIMFSKEL